MDSPPPQPATRRAFVQSLARYTALGGLLGITAIAVSRRAGSSPACPRDSLCQGCPTAGACTLPQKQAVAPTPKSDS